MKTDRHMQPAVRIPDRLDIPMPEIRRLAGGTGLYVLNAPQQEVTRLSLVYRAGTRFQSRPFTAATVMNLLAEGTEKYSAAEFSERFDFYGAHFETGIDRDYAVVTLCTLSRFLPQSLELLEEMTARPLFPVPELDIYRERRKQQLSVDRQKVSFRARELFTQALFGQEHPYGSFYDRDEFDALTQDVLQAFFRKHYTAGNCFAVVSGKAGSEEVQRIETFLASLPAGAGVSFADLPEPVTTPLVQERREEALQTAIRIGKRLFPRNHPDFIGMQVLSMVLGGYFGSRLISNLREDKGYTYGVFSAMVNLESAGYLAIATEVGAPFTRDAVREIFRELARLREEPVGAEELKIVKNMITGDLMRILDGPFGIADVTIESVQNGTDNGYVARYFEEVKAITPERLQELARRHLNEAGFVTVTVGAVDECAPDSDPVLPDVPKTASV